MIGSTRQVTVWAYGAPADLRKGFDGLSLSTVAQGEPPGVTHVEPARRRDRTPFMIVACDPPELSCRRVRGGW
jgi:hypothetical protein